MRPWPLDMGTIWSASIKRRNAEKKNRIGSSSSRHRSDFGKLRSLDPIRIEAFRVVLSLRMPKVKRILHNLWEDLKDRFDRTPPPAANEPRPLHYMPGIGKGEFERIGRELVRHFVEVGDLQPSDRVLDVGCGLGRMVEPLQDVLDDSGSYEGFDVVRDIIRWDRRHLTYFDPRFQFRFVDVYNSSYNPHGLIQPERFRFPYPDGELDFVFATSVFTHLLAGSTSKYLEQCARVLKPGGRLFATFFLLDDTTRRLIEEGESDIDFRYPWELGLLMNEDKPEDAVAYRAEWVFDRLDELGLDVRQPPSYGAWSGREGGLDYQDILVADKR